MKLMAVILLACLCQTAMSQKDDKFFAFDKDWKGADIKKAAYLVRLRPQEDKTFLLSTYQIFGPRISQETFQDDKATIRSGDCRYYHLNGYLDSAGNCVNNLPDGSWWYYDEKGIAYKKKGYNKGVLVLDSAIAPPAKDAVSKSEPDPGEVESSFNGGVKGWMKFMNTNFEYPARAQSSNVEGTVYLEFMVDEKGTIQHPEINKSAEYSLDEEALRLIRKSPVWIPATKDGKPVKSYKRQPVIFKLTQ